MADNKSDKILTLVEGLVERVEKVEKSVAATPDYSRAAPYGVVGAIPGDQDGYSILKAAAYAIGRTSSENCKYEIDASNKLAALYKGCGWRPHHSNSLIVPYCTNHIPIDTTEGERLVRELKVKMIANADKVDQDEAAWLRKRIGGGMVRKDLGTLSDAAGGVLVGFPTLGELVDLQRNVEVFAQAGATEQSLPPNGRLQIPKLTGATTAYWVGEGSAVTESTNATGYLDLQAKKLGILTDINNELIRFASITAESMIRSDMALVAALKADLAMLEGTGGTQIKGLITYPSASSWTPGTDALLAYTVTSNLIQVSDGASMEALLPDTSGDPTAWVMRRDLWAKVRNRRADAVSAADAAGPYLASITRTMGDRMGYEWDGTKVVRSGQISNTRSSTKTYVLLGNFKDWVTARFGVVEFKISDVGDTQMTNDQTRLRAIQHIDAGPRHASSFVFADNVNVA